MLFLHKFVDIRKFVEYTFHKFVEEKKDEYNSFLVLIHVHTNTDVGAVSPQSTDVRKLRNPNSVNCGAPQMNTEVRICMCKYCGCYFSTKYGRPQFAEKIIP